MTVHVVRTSTLQEIYVSNSHKQNFQNFYLQLFLKHAHIHKVNIKSDITTGASSRKCILRRSL